jgi:outer membrane protein assembly factor BamB
MNAIALQDARVRVFTLVLLLILGAAFNSAAAQPDPPENLLQKCWAIPSTSPTIVEIGSDSSAIYISSDDGSVRSISVTSGDALWSAELGGSISSNFVINGSSLFVVSRPASEGIGGEKQVSVVRSLSKQTGVTSWGAKIPFAETTYLLDGGNGVLIAAGGDGSLTAVSKENGNIVWNASIPGTLAGKPAIKNGSIAVAVNPNDLYTVSTDDGRIIRHSKIKFLPTAISFANDGSLLLGDERGNLVWLDAKDGDTVWKFKNGARISHAVETDRGVLAASYDNFVYLLTAYRGGVVWKRRLSGRISDAPIILGDMVFVRTSGDKQAYLISLKTGKIVQKIETGESDVVRQAPLSQEGVAIVIGGASGVALYGLRSCPAK